LIKHRIPEEQGSELLMSC